uniref:SS18 N-terminal domain-containing protein n=1 Tax=Ciona intestinalis TaxID=7719 RepID=H2Y3B8_CIOIN
MSSAFVPQAVRNPKSAVTQETIQKMLDENSRLIQCIVDEQQNGRMQDCSRYQQILHRNLVWLATVADSNQSNGQNMMAGTSPSPHMVNKDMNQINMQQTSTAAVSSQQAPYVQNTASHTNPTHTSSENAQTSQAPVQAQHMENQQFQQQQQQSTINQNINQQPAPVVTHPRVQVPQVHYPGTKQPAVSYPSQPQPMYSNYQTQPGYGQHTQQHTTYQQQPQQQSYPQGQYPYPEQ